jgi:hypothetical protein
MHADSDPHTRTLKRNTILCDNVCVCMCISHSSLDPKPFSHSHHSHTVLHGNRQSRSFILNETKKKSYIYSHTVLHGNRQRHRGL